MKTYKNLCSKIYDIENLFRAFRAARKAKRSRAAVPAGYKRHPFEFDLYQKRFATVSDTSRYVTGGVKSW